MSLSRHSKSCASGIGAAVILHQTAGWEKVPRARAGGRRVPLSSERHGDITWEDKPTRVPVPSQQVGVGPEMALWLELLQTSRTRPLGSEEPPTCPPRAWATARFSWCPSQRRVVVRPPLPMLPETRTFPFFVFLFFQNEKIPPTLQGLMR